MSSAIPSVAPAASPAARRRRPFPILFGFVTLPVLALDQASKFYVRSHMTLYETVPLIRNWLDLTYTQNTGAAFSMFTNMPPWFRGAVLASLAVAAIVMLLIMLVQSDRLSMNSIAFALIMAGAAGNLIDRASRGQVTDFIRAHYYSLSYPVFNVADSAITIGVVLILLGVFLDRADSA